MRRTAARHGACNALARPRRVGAQADLATRNAVELWQTFDNEIRPALVGTVTIAIDPDNVETAPLILTRMTAGQDLTGVTVATGHRIGGRIRRVEAPAAAVSRALVVLRETGAQTTTHDDGRFRFERAPRGPVTMVDHAPGGQPASWTMEVPSPNDDLEL